MSKPIGEIFNFSIRVRILGLLVLGAIVLITIYFCLPSLQEHLKYVAAILGGAAAIYSAYYVGDALRLQVVHRRQAASFEILALLNRPEFAEVRNFVGSELEGHEEVPETKLYEMIISNSDLDNSVTIVLGILEDMSIAIQCDFVDEDILYKSLVCIVKRNFDALQGYIHQLRKRRNDPVYFVELAKLYNSWDSKRRLSDGKAFS